VYFLVNLRNRIIVVTQWLWSYLVFERGARLITGASPPGPRTE
jgi:NADH dehydrogenase